MTVTSTANTITYSGNASSTNFSYSFLIPTSGDAVVTLTEKATGITSVLDSSVYRVNGTGISTGGSVDYPLVGSPLAATYNISIQRILAETQVTQLTGQDGLYPETIEAALDRLTMLIQQVDYKASNALAFPVGGSSVTADQLIIATLNAASYVTAAQGYATAAQNSANAAAASAASIALLSTANTWQKVQTPTAAALTTTIAADFSAAQVHTAAITSSSAFVLAAPSVNPPTNSYVTVIVTMTGTGAFTPNATFKGMSAYTQSVWSSGTMVDHLTFLYNGTNYALVGYAKNVTA